jgi:hypothetical protein
LGEKSIVTIAKARKLLGKSAELLTDEEVQLKIDVAEQLKELFFDFLLKSLRQKKAYQS